MELLILVHRKSANASTFSVITFVHILEIWEAFLVSESKIYFSVYSYFCKKIFLLLYLAWMVRTFGLFLYFTKVFKVKSSIFCAIGSKFEYWGILTFFTIFEKNLLNTSAVFSSVLVHSPFSVQFILSPLINLSENKGFTTSQNCLFSRIYFRWDLHNTWF